MQGKGTAQAAAHLQVAGFGVKFWSNPFCGQGFIELLAQALQLQSTPLVDPELSVVYPVPELTDSRRRWEAVGGQHGLVTVKAIPEQNEFGRCKRVHYRAVLRGIASVHRLDQPRSSRLAVRVSLVHPCNHVQPGHFGLCNTGAMSTIATHRVWDGGGWVDGWVGGGRVGGFDQTSGMHRGQLCTVRGRRETHILRCVGRGTTSEARAWEQGLGTHSLSA